MNIWRAARKASVASAIVVGVVTANAATAWGDPAGVGTVAWLSAGDSYASGEGIAGTGVGTDTCAQSTLAYGPRAAELLARQRSWTITPSRFVACTGAKIGDYFGGAATANGGRGPQWIQAVERDATRRFDVITLSLGGNDIRFADTLTTCIDTPLTTDSWTGIVLDKKVGDGPCAPTLDDIKARIDALSRGSFQQPEGAYPSSGPMTLADFYVKVANDGLTKRGLLVVAGYPRLFAPTSEWGQWRHGRCQLVKAADADCLDRRPSTSTKSYETQ